MFAIHIYCLVSISPKRASPRYMNVALSALRFADIHSKIVNCYKELLETEVAFMEERLIITIGRQTGSGGKKIGKLLASLRAQCK